MKTRLKRQTFVTLTALIALLAISIACGTETQNNQGSEVTPVTPKALSSSTALPVTEAVKIISVDGSSTVFPVTEAVAEEYYIKTNGEIPVTVGVSGTGGGMKKFCRGETHISNASRPQKEKERILCEEGGFTSVELPVAIDGLTVVVNKENDFVDCMTVAQLNTIWDPSSEGKITMWNQVDPSWPAEKMELYGPGQDSGTFDYFTETVNGESQASRGDFTASEDDNVLVTGVSGDKYALAYFGYAYFAENADKLKAIEIVNDQGNCVAPEAAAINSGEYNPLSRPLFIYVRGDVATVEPVKSFVEFYLSSAGRALVGEVGYVAYPDEVYELALGRLQSANTQLLWGGDNPKSGGVLERLKNNQ